MLEVVNLETGEIVHAHFFTGHDANRQPTRDFVERTIVIRQGRFMLDIDGKVTYVSNGDWVVKDDAGALSRYTAAEFHQQYRPTDAP